MPYYVFALAPFTAPEKLTEHDTYGSASTSAKALRLTLDAGSPVRIKLMFADSEDMAADLLCQVRTAGPSGDE